MRGAEHEHRRASAFAARRDIRDSVHDEEQELSTSLRSPKDVLEAFYDAERTFMRAGGLSGGASFDAMAATLDENVTLHQSPDLPFGGTYVGHDGYRRWAEAMSAIFAEVDAQNAEFFVRGDAVVIVCTLVTHTRGTREVMRSPMVQLVTVVGGKITEFRPFYWNVPQYVDAAERARRFNAS